MRDVFSILFLLLFVIIRAAFCGYTTKTINESKGYTGGFWMGVLLAELGILIAVFKKELPDAPPNSYRVVSVVKVLKKFHYPFVSPQVEPIDILKGNIYAEGEAAKVNLVFWLIHGMFMLAWYSVILGAYLWYVIGYTVYWLFKYKLFKKGTTEDSVRSAVNAQSIKDSVVGGIGGLKERAGSTASKLSQKTEGVKTGAAEKAALAKEKAGSAFAGVKGKASEFAAEHKKAENNAAPSDDISEEASITSTDANAAEKALDTAIRTSEPISEVSESASFDELYEKAMNTADDERLSDETTTSETGIEESYNGETVNEVEAPVATSVKPTPAPTITQQPAQSQYDYSEKKKSPVVFILVGVIAVLLVGMGILGGMLLMKNKNDKSDKKENAVSDDTAVTDTSLLNSETTTTESIDSVTNDTTTNTPTEVHQENKIESKTVFSCSKDEVNSKYLEIINGMDFIIPHRGFLTDLNGDGVSEIIVPEVSDMTYTLYYYDSGSVKLCSFGSFMALGNFEMFSVDGDDGKKYIYYRDNYSYKSSQGYFSLDEMSEIDISLNFPSTDSGTADWSIDYNGNENFGETERS